MIVADPYEIAAGLQEDNDRLRELLRKQNIELAAKSKELHDRQYAAQWGITYEKLLELDAKFYECLRRVRETP